MIKFKNFLKESALDFLRQPYNDLQEVDVARDALHDLGGEDYLGIWIDNTINFIIKETIANTPMSNFARLSDTLDDPVAANSLLEINHIFKFAQTIDVCEYGIDFESVKEICDQTIAYLHTNPNKSEIVFETIKRLINETKIKETIKEHCDQIDYQGAL